MWNPFRRPASVKMYPTAADIYPDLGGLIAGTKREFVAVGASFDRSTKHFQHLIEGKLRDGVAFRYVHLSRGADFALFAPQFGQTPDELSSEVESTYAVFDKYRQAFPKSFSHFPTRRCPNYRMYVADPDGPAPPGIIVFYGSSTDSPLLPAYRVRDFNQQPWRAYLGDFTRFDEQKTNRNVFLIHGHGEGQWRHLADILRQEGLNPVVMVDEPGGGKTYLEKFIQLAKQCRFAVAVFTPDDLVSVAARPEDAAYGQPRPNAIFEVGYFAGTIGRANTIVICQEPISLFSDFHGVDVLRFRRSVEECYLRLESELKRAELL